MENLIIILAIGTGILFGVLSLFSIIASIKERAYSPLIASILLLIIILIATISLVNVIRTPVVLI